MRLPRGLEMEPFGQPVLAVALAELLQCLSQLFQGFEVAHSEQLLLEGAEEAFDPQYPVRPIA